MSLGVGGVPGAWRGAGGGLQAQGWGLPPWSQPRCPPGEACWWTIHPASKQRSEGEKVRVGDDLILVSVSSERYLVRACASVCGHVCAEEVCTCREVGGQAVLEYTCACSCVHRHACLRGRWDQARERGVHM